MARFFCPVAYRFLSVGYDSGVMLGVIGAAKDLSVQHEVLGVCRIVQLKITLRRGVANSAAVVTAAIGRANLGAASIVGHAPVMNGAERLKVVARLVVGGLFWGHNVLGHNRNPLRQ